MYEYDRVPEGRLYYRTNTADGVYLHATADATEYAPGTLEQIANHERRRSLLQGFRTMPMTMFLSS